MGGGARCGQSVPGCAAGVCMGSRGGGAVRPVCHWLGCVCLYGVTWGGGGGGPVRPVCQSVCVCAYVRASILFFMSLVYLEFKSHP